MRVQLYPPNNIAFIGTKTVSLNLSSLASSSSSSGHLPFIEFDTKDGATEYDHLISGHVENVDEDRNAEQRVLDNTGVTLQGHCRATSQVIDGQRFNTFFFDRAGDILPMHTHDENTVHYSVVTKGAFALHTSNDDRVVKAGDPIINWQAGDWHAFTAIEDDSQLLNIVKVRKA